MYRTKLCSTRVYKSWTLVGSSRISLVLFREHRFTSPQLTKRRAEKLLEFKLKGADTIQQSSLRSSIPSCAEHCHRSSALPPSYAVERVEYFFPNPQKGGRGAFGLCQLRRLNLESFLAWSINTLSTHLPVAIGALHRHHGRP